MHCDQQPGMPGTEIKESMSPTNFRGDDIQREVARKLQASEERYRALALACGQIVWTSTAEGLVQEDLQTWCAYTGQSQEEALGWGWLEVVHSDDRERVRRIWLHAIATHTIYETEYRVQRHDGVCRNLLSRAVPVLEADGRVREWVGVCTDITERKKLEEGLRESSRRMDEFLSIASHELRTPLTTLKANIQLAERRVKKCLQNEAMEAHERLEKLTVSRDLLLRADRQVVVLNRLVGDLLDVARIREDKFELKLHRKPCNLVAVVQEAIQEQQQVHPSRSISLELPADAAVTPYHGANDTSPHQARTSDTCKEVPVFADAVRIGQVVSNYLTNALKYAPPRSPVAVRIQIEGAVARVLVRDEGPGLPLQEQQRIWERFYQVPGVEAKTGSGVGLGLGLHITKMIIDLHQGEVGVESIPGKGATFWFTLPLAEKGQE